MKQKMQLSKDPSSAVRANSKISGKSSKETLEGILTDMLKDMYWAENHLLKALGKMATAAHNDDLKAAFTKHQEETKGQIERLEDCFDILEMKPVSKKCEAMEGLVKEGAEVIQEYEKGHARDAALIAAAQKAEHYEVSAYGTMRTMSTVLSEVQCAEWLEMSKNEEVETDEALTTLAKRINQLAAEVEIEEVQ